MSIVVIGPDEKKLIAEAIAKARATPIPLDVLRALQHPIPDGGIFDLKDRRQPFKRPESEHVMLPGGFRASISFEQQPDGLARHLSVSSPNRLRIPNVPAVKMIAEAFGFKLAAHMLWLEEFEPGWRAVNILEFVDG